MPLACLAVVQAFGFSTPGLLICQSQKRGSVFGDHINEQAEMGWENCFPAQLCFLRKDLLFLLDWRSLKEMGDAASRPVYEYKGWGGEYIFLRLRMGFSEDLF